MSLSIQLNRRITLQSRVIGQDEYGQASTAWANVVTNGDGKVWASIVDVTGREFVAAGGTQNAAQTKIMIRYRDGIVPAMRVLHGDDIYNVEAVLGQDRRTLTLMASRGVSDG